MSAFSGKEALLGFSITTFIPKKGEAPTTRTNPKVLILIAVDLNIGGLPIGSAIDPNHCFSIVKTEFPGFFVPTCPFGQN